MLAIAELQQLSLEDLIGELGRLPLAGDGISFDTVGDQTLLEPRYAGAALAVTHRDKLTPLNRRELVRVILRACYVGVSYSPHMTYTESTQRWSGIVERVHDITGKAPPFCDCSSFATWAYWGPMANWLKWGDILNGLGWRAGYTGTMTPHGTRIWIPQPGDLCFYGDLTVPYHVAVHVGNSRVVSMGRQGCPCVEPVGPASQYRRYF